MASYATQYNHESKKRKLNDFESYIKTSIAYPPAISDAKISQVTYRVRGIPLEYNMRQVQELLQSVLGLDAARGTVQVKSIAISPNQKTKMATVNFQNPPPCLSSDRKEWSFEIPDVDNSDAESDDDDDIIPKAPTITIDSHFRGITILGSFKNVAEHKIDCVAISGLGGHAFGSFKDRAGPHMWLRDSLPSDITGARVMIYGYDTQLHDSHTFQDLEALGSLLRSDLQTLTTQDSRHTKPKTVPLIFVAHSLGGLIVKEAIIQMKRDKNHHALLDSIYGALFFGVPSQGMEITSLIPLVKDQPNQGLLHSLGKESQILRNQCRDFPKAFGHEHSEIICFYETDMSPTAAKDGEEWKMTGPLSILVDSSSARHGRPWENEAHHCMALKRSHSELVKFSSNDEDYERVLAVLKRMMSNAVLVIPRVTLSTKEKEEMTPQDYDCLKSFAFPEITYRRQEADQAHLHTCEWILQHRSYTKWISKEHELLWIKGKPGAGKSTLMAFLYQEFQASQDNFLFNQRIRLEFFFHGRGAALQKTPIGMFRSLLHQIYTKIPLVRLPIQTAFKEKKSFGEAGASWEWQCKELQDLFSNALIDSAKLWKITIFVDALDEAGSAVAQGLAMYFHDLNDKLAAKKGSSRICISCRHYPIVAANNSLEIRVEDENHDDITKYVKHRLNSGIQGMKMVGLSIDEFQKLEGTIVTRASGVFQWARLVVPLVVDLNQQGESLQYIYKELSKVPTDLSDVYEHIFTKVIEPRNRIRTLHLMQWICLADVPLSVTELRFAIASDDLYIHPARGSCKEAKDFVDTDARMERLITSLSGGLVEVKHHMSKTTVQFIHQSVNDFLLSGGLKELASSTDDIIGQSQGRLSKSCINYLRLEEVLVGGSELADHKRFDRTNVSSRLENLPFLKYATRFWFLHAEKAESFGISQHDLVQQLGSPPGPAFQTWVKIYRTIYPYYAKCPQLGSTLLHIASSSNLGSVVQILLRDNVNINGKDDAGNRALHYASRWGHKDLAEILINAGADIGAKSWNNSTALECAAGNGHEEMLRLLLHRGADVNESTGKSGNALQAAATKGNRILVNMLLEAGADVNAQAGHYGNALQAAAYGGHAAVVTQLLEAGADVNAQAGHYGNALQAAAYRGHAAVVTQLLEAGADVNLLNQFFTAIQHILSLNINAKAQVLLDRGAQIKAFHEGVEANNEYIVKLALGNGMRTDVPCGWFKYALHTAAYNGDVAIVSLLLAQSRKELDFADCSGQTPFALAAREGHVPVLATLFKLGVNVNSQDLTGRTPLWWASANGHDEAVAWLLCKNADLHIPNNDGVMPLAKALMKGHNLIVKTLEGHALSSIG
ncbi:hypothetical protein VE03_09999 [Pseudogymnoascus sp. 23342-1-I1]|nr:hypothetical protein VE03_09999 [Pseudogymnoascus sp. 23342-1-I1]